MSRTIIMKTPTNYTYQYIADKLSISLMLKVLNIDIIEINGQIFSLKEIREKDKR